MNIVKRIIAVFLAVLMIASAVPASVFAAVKTDKGIEASDNGGIYKIANDYVRFVYNSNTGAFSVETKEGHPQKSYDNRIPLLYSEDASRSNGTSYTTVRIDGKDYIFGQDYSWFGIETDIYTPVITNGGRVMTVSWGVKGYLITQTAIISEVEDSDLAGNIGIGYTVVNMNETEGNVGIRLLLDNALDSKVDAPYVLTEALFSPTIVETEYSDADGNMPAQLTYVDSIANTKKMAYAMLKGWSGEQDTTPDKVIVGHWANLANTRYDYVADVNCDFSNYSNTHRVPDTATAIYWSEKTIPAKSSRTMEMLYGIGNFTKDLGEDHFGISVNVPSVKLDNTKEAYENNGEIELKITLDNTVDGALDIAAMRVDITLDEGVTFKSSGKNTATYDYGQVIGEQILTYAMHKGEYKVITETLVVAPEANITSKSVIVNVSSTECQTETEWVQGNYSSTKNILVPGVDSVLPDVKMTAISPEIVYFDGEKNLTVSGDMTSLKSLRATSGWEMFLVKGNHNVHINKSDIAFTNESYQTMTFSTTEELELGEYSLEFRFTDDQLKAEFTDKIIASKKITVSDDEYYRSQSYGLVAMVRFDNGGYPAYDFFSFINEEHLNNFKDGNIPMNGLKYKDVTYDDECEVMAVVRGNIRRMQEGERIFYQANTADGDVTINNLLIYTGTEPLTMEIDGDWASSQKDNTAVISGKGTIKVINSITVWHHGWSLEGKAGVMSTLSDPEEGEEFVLSLGIGGSILQYIGGLLIELKYGQMTESDGLYGISFGGKVTIPIKAKEQKKDNKDTNKDNNDKDKDKDTNKDDNKDKDKDKDNNTNKDNATTTTSKSPAGFTKPSGDKPPSLELATSDTKLGKYVNSLGTIEDEPDDGSISGEISDIIFGQKAYNEETGEFETGFVGIDCSLEVNLPADVLGGPFKNKVGIEATVSVNTIEKSFGIDFGLELKDAFECSVELAFKQISRKQVERYYPDVIKVYLGGDFMRIPFFGVPGTFVTGLGGGVSNLSDTLKDKEEGEEISPLTIHVRLDLLFAELLCGSFEGEFSSEFVNITGELTLNNDDDGKILKVEAGVNIRWKPSVNINIYGNATLLDGLMKGGITVKIQKDYFYVYIFSSLCVPDSIPIIGGYELGGVEAAGSSDFIGANIKIIGIKFGFIYYWGGDFHIGQGIDLGSRGGAVTSYDASYYDENGKYVMCTALYGTNLRRLTSTKVDTGRAGGVVIKKYFDPTSEQAVLFEIPIEGFILPSAQDIILLTPSGKQIEMIESDGMGGGNYLINDRGENSQKYLYITITDKNLLEKGEWQLSIATDGVSISNFEVNAVDNLPDLASVDYSYNADAPYSLNVEYTLDCTSSVPGAIDVYITDNPNALDGIRQSVADPSSSLIPVDRITLDKMESGSATVTIPDTLTNGDYYVLCMLSQDVGGMSTAMSETAFSFKNDLLPDNVDAIKVTYGGDGDLRIELERPDEVDYDTYIIRILDENYELFNNGMFEVTVEDKIYNETLGAYENEVYYYGEDQGLIPGQTYYVCIDTLRTEDDNRYYSNDTLYSEAFVMPEKQTPVLLSVETNIDPEASVIGVDTFEATYTFDRDVYFYLIADTLQKSYSTECKKVHTVSLPLLEGDHFIEFFAVTPAYDTTDSSIHDEACFAFRVDTTPPNLKIAQSLSESMSNENKGELIAVSQQNVVVDENGKIKFEGMTDSDAVLTLDGTTDGITRNVDGTFTVERKIDSTQQTGVLCATDKAGNKTAIPVHYVDPSLTSFSALSLTCDIDFDNPDDVKKITIPVGTTVNLGVYGVSENKNVALDNTSVLWSVLYEKNIIDFNDGRITALVPGETAISVLYNVASFEVDGKLQTKTLSDTVIIEVAERKVNIDGDVDTSVSVDYSRIDYAEYSKLTVVLDLNGTASVTSTVGDSTIVFYLDGKDTYVASLDRSYDTDEILAGISIDTTGNTNKLIKGDYDGNGVVDYVDRDLSIEKFIGISNADKLNSDSYIRGDVNEDGVINIIDAQMILRTSIGK